MNLLCIPLYNTAEKWQEIERNTIKRLKPKIDRIKASFSGDERFMILQTFYRQNHYHPAYALRSAFGLLLQIPFFIAAYSWISSLETLKGAPYLFIKNLSEPDSLLSIGGISINVLPVLMTALNVISGILYTKGFPLKDKIQVFGISALFLILLYNSPSALVIYWTFNNIFSLFRNIFKNIKTGKKQIIAHAGFSSLLIFISIYLLFFYQGNISLRIIVSVFCIIITFFTWMINFFRRYNSGSLFRKISDCFPRNRLSLFILSIAAVWILSGLFLPARLIASSPQEFCFIDEYTTPFYFIINTLLQSMGFFFLWPLLIYLLFKKHQRLFSVIAPVILFWALLNTFLFSGSYGLISLEMVFERDVNHSLAEIAINTAALAIIASIVYLLYRIKKEKIINTIIGICAVSMFCLSIIDLYTINSEFNEVNKFKSVSTDTINIPKPLFYLSKTGRNTVIINLDRAISAYIPYIFEENPKLLESYSGFVYYPNTVSFNGHTRIAVPPLFGGYEYTPLEMNRRNAVPLVDKHNEALLLMPGIFSKTGYTVTVTDPPYPNYSEKGDLSIFDSYTNVFATITDSVYTKSWLNEHNLSFASKSQILRRNLFWYGLFRISPLALRRGLYLQGDWCSADLSKKITLTIDGYAVLDYLPKLTGIKNDTENTVLIMTNNTTHENSFLQAPDYRPAVSISNYGSSPFKKFASYHVNAASINRLGEWFDFLKSQDVWDNTRIILVSDHGAGPYDHRAGANFPVKINLPFNVEQLNPLLLVKDFMARGNLITDSSFMSNADVPYLTFKNQIENPINPFTGNAISTAMKSNPLYIAISGTNRIENKKSNIFILDPKKDYYVHSNIFNSNNWEKAEQ